MDKKGKNLLIFFSKLAIACILIAWPIKQGKLDFNLLKEFLHHRSLDWLLALSILIAASFVSSYRWKYILDLKARSKVSYWQTVKINWIGLFFNPLLPGSASGDMVKILYARDMDKNLTPGYLFSSVLIDRIFGLISLIIIMGLASCLSWNKLMAISQEMEQLVWFNMGLFFCACGLICFLLSPKKIQNPIKKVLAIIPWVGIPISKLLDHFWFIGKKKSSIPFCILLSIPCQSLSIFVFWFLSHPYLASQISPLDLAVIYPLGFIIISIPITPMGLGLGHIVFDKLFDFYNISGGANYFNAYILTHIIKYMLGIFPYLLSRKKLSSRELDSLKEQ